jgi:hypothetical protein
VTLTLLIVVNLALAAAIVVVLAFVMTSLARLTRDQPAAPRFGAVPAGLPREPGLAHVSRAPHLVRAPAQAGVRT